jgi:hypothetical protein
MTVFGAPNNTLVLGPFLVGPKTDLKTNLNIVLLKLNFMKSNLTSNFKLKTFDLHNYLIYKMYSNLITL